MAGLILGPMTRWAGTSEATVWVETDAACEVEVRADGVEPVRARTFCVKDHHYAIARVRGLPEDAATPYTVALDGDPVWPEPEARSRRAACAPTPPTARHGSCSARAAPPIPMSRPGA